ncbi:EamA family transporter [Streptomyces armeniacus]|uniref:EamA family transporter n=1 Tax=Streptomyces armeniacus TaxID=83291 RepID=A0A345XYR0_9ACTN|nr:EamA family transporter [Streptomyces armeniacus]AXK36776.1 EamA family transporter [Streptomyces armeniacus]
MTPLVAAAVLAAAVTHAGWNAIAHGIKDQLVAFSLIGAADLVCGAAVAAYAPLPAAGAWPYLIASVLLHIGYQALLMRSFRLGDFGQVYPIARGTAPLAVTVLALVFVHERPGLWQTTGVAVASAGLVGVALWGIRGRAGDVRTGADPGADPGANPGAEAGARAAARPQTAALLAAVGTGLAIASYTVVDGMGVRASGSALGYTGWLVALMGPCIPLYALAVRRRALLAQLRPVAWRGLLGGALSTAAYGLVLWAQTRAPLAPVAALRETSVIAGAAIGALFFKERFGAPRIAASAVLALGIALMLTT